MKNYISILITAMVFGTMANASIIAAWENNHLAGGEASTTAGEAPSAGSFDANLASAPVLSRGAGATTTVYGDTFAFRNGDDADLATAISNDRYLTWTLQAASGYDLSLENTFIRVTSQDQPVDMALFSSVGGFTASDAIDTWNVLDTGTQIFTENTTDLSGIAGLQNTTSAVEFRLYYWGKTSQYAQIGIGRAFNGDSSSDLVVNGTLSAIPEPSVIALLGLSVGFLIYVRRRR